MARAKPTPVEKPTEKTVVRKALITKNSDTLRFKFPPFYNLATIRKNLITLVTRTAGDEKKYLSIKETLETALEFLEVRHAHAVKVRAKEVKAKQAERDAAAKAAAEHDLNVAQSHVRDADAAKSKWSEVVDALKGKSK